MSLEANDGVRLVPVERFTEVLRPLEPVERGADIVELSVTPRDVLAGAIKRVFYIRACAAVVAAEAYDRAVDPSDGDEPVASRRPVMPPTWRQQILAAAISPLRR